MKYDPGHVLDRLCERFSLGILCFSDNFSPLIPLW